MKNALVTGGTGFIGANLVRRLLNDGYEAHCLVRSHDVSWRLKDVAKDIHFHMADVRDGDKVKDAVQAVQPLRIFHLATAGIYGGKSGSDEDLFQTNVLGLVHLLNAAKEIPYESFINTGSSSEYGIAQKPMQEDGSCKPANIYGVSKLAATHYASLHAKQFQKPVITLRLFSPYGPFDDPQRFVPYAITRSLQNQELRLGSPESVRDYIYVEDVIDAYMAAVGRISAIGGEVFNIGSGQEISVGEATERIRETCKAEAPLHWGMGSAGRPWESPRWQADIAKAKEMLGWEPKTSFSEGLDKTIEWFRMNLLYYGRD